MARYRIRECGVYEYSGKPMFQLERQTWIGRWVYAGELGDKEKMLRELKAAQNPEIIYGDQMGGQQ